MPINTSAGVKLLPLSDFHKRPVQSLMEIARAGGDVIIIKSGKPFIRIDKITDLTGELSAAAGAGQGT